LQVVTGAGYVVDCNQTGHPELFNAALAGQGQCAVIARATLRLQPAPLCAREYMLPYPDLQSLLVDGMGLSQDGRFDGLVALIVPTPEGWSYAIAATRYFVPPALPDDAAALAGLQFKRGAEQVADQSYIESVDVAPPVDFTQYHADLGLLVAQAAIEPFLSGMLPRLVPDDLGAVMAIRAFFLPRLPFTRPLLRVPHGGHFCYLALIRAQTDEPEALQRMLSGNRELFEGNRELGGTLYPFAALKMRALDWQRHYGEQQEFLTRMKRRHDPQQVLVDLS
jgi:cytokinin dehydrogenase